MSIWWRIASDQTGCRPQRPYKFSDYYPVFQLNKKGAQPHKLSLGLASYGRSFTLLNPEDHGYMAPCKLGSNGYYSGEPGPYTREPGYLAYYEICEDIRNKGSVNKIFSLQLLSPIIFSYLNFCFVFFLIRF